MIGVPSSETVWKPIGNGIEGAAELSECGQYRYWLGRRWAPKLGFVGFIGLNPSTADAMRDDPTIRRCINFATAWGYGGIYMLNLFAYRATDPQQMKYEAADPIGPKNDETLDYIVTKCQRIIACWGAEPFAVKRAKQLTLRGRWLECLGLTKSGAPRHPLYVPGNTKPMSFQWHGGTDGRTTSR